MCDDDFKINIPISAKKSLVPDDELLMPTLVDTGSSRCHSDGEWQESVFKTTLIVIDGI